MKYESVVFDRGALKRALEARGLTEREFAVFMWGANTHRGLSDFFRSPNLTIKTAMKLCNFLGVTLDQLYGGSDIVGASPYKVGESSNDDMSDCTDLNALHSKIKAQQLLLKEKDHRIADLKKVNDSLIKKIFFSSEPGQNSDKK